MSDEKEEAGARGRFLTEGGDFVKLTQKEIEALGEAADETADEDAGEESGG